LFGVPRPPQAQLVALYYDDPQTTPADRLRSDAALSFPPGSDVPAGLIERRIAAGEYATIVHAGPYNRLGDAWIALKQEIATRGFKTIAAPGYEVYLNDPTSAAPDELRTELFAPIE
jgi:AraC family transcriptional regulator